MEKGEILKEFSADPDRYYRVGLFGERGFARVRCSRCGRYFWTLDAGRTLCPDDAEDTYSFIGDPPTSKRFDYTQSWRQVEEFFVGNGHASVSRYPVVCRWRDDLYFTVASIVDFQRVMGSKVVFEFPANPLVVPQTCLRFKDLENVGVTGRHFSSFCMIGQHSVPGPGGYWKDECVDLDYRLLTDRFGIRGEEVVFVEDVWAGGGSFGPSLEYFVRGLELGNAVFTEFQGELGRHAALDQRIIDMGAGLERFAWITNGTPTAYDCCFGPVTERLLGEAGADADSDLLGAYFTGVARALESSGDLAEVRRRAAAAAGISGDRAARVVAPLEGAYLIADHLRTLVFAIADGALPSNVGGGYNLRMILRRVIGTIGRLGLRLDLDELVDMHVDYLRDTYPELDARRRDVKTILGIESARYQESKARMGKIAGGIRGAGREPSVDELVRLYESDGVTPDYLKEAGAIAEIPPAFYTRLADLHQSGRGGGGESLPLDGLPETEMLFYGDDPPEFEATVLRSFGRRVVLDRTAFYARGGGQEPDRGTVGGRAVEDVGRHAGVIVHTLAGGEGAPAEGEAVRCAVDRERRAGITKNHTSTHILNASARKVLGSWVWQHSAFKEADHARLDVTHHSSLSDGEVRQIEDAANDMVRRDLPVTVEYLDRGDAERRYGFRIYQGGVVPVKAVRVVSIRGEDVEACGGTHVGRTGEIGLIRITRTKRIQDGVVRLEFVSGAAALDHAEREKADAERGKADAERRRRVEAGREASRARARERIPGLLEQIGAGRTGVLDGIEVADGGACFTDSGEYDEFFHVNFGRRLVRAHPRAAHCGIFRSGPTVRVVVHCGRESGMEASRVASEVAGILGGAGGGDAEFAQGGGRDTLKRGEAAARARSAVLGRR